MIRERSYARYLRAVLFGSMVSPFDHFTQSQYAYAYVMELARVFFTRDGVWIYGEPIRPLSSRVARSLVRWSLI